MFHEVFIQSSISTDSPYCELIDYILSEKKHGSFSNFSHHVARKHEKELEIFFKSNKSDPMQPSMGTLSIPLVIARRKQTELEKIMGKLFIHENILLNLVRSQLFRDFCKLSISCFFPVYYISPPYFKKYRPLKPFNGNRHKS